MTRPIPPTPASSPGQTIPISIPVNCCQNIRSALDATRNFFPNLREIAVRNWQATRESLTKQALVISLIFFGVWAAFGIAIALQTGAVFVLGKWVYLAWQEGRVESHAARLARENVRLSRANRQLETELTGQSHRMLSLGQEAASRIDEVEQENKKLGNIAKDRRETLRSLEQTKVQIESKIRTLTDRLAESQRSLTSASSAYQELQEQMNSATRTNQELRSSLATHQSLNLQLNQKNSVLIEQNRQLEESRKQISETSQKILTQKNLLEHALAALYSQTEALEARLAEKEQAYLNQLEIMEGEKNLAERLCLAKDANAQSIEAELQSMQQKIVDFEKRNKELESQCTALLQKLAALSSSNRQSSSNLDRNNSIATAFNGAFDSIEQLKAGLKDLGDTHGK